MITLYLALLFVPISAIFVWGRLVSRLSTHAWAIYKYTGIIGTPVHELAHVVACLLFRLRIRRIALFAPDAIKGRLGYVEFSHNPFSALHAVGLLVQGVAPLLAGGAIAILGLGMADRIWVPDQGALPLLAWIADFAWATVAALLALAGESLGGAALAILLLVVCMHAIPSVADVAVAMRGFIIIALLVAALVLVAQIAPPADEVVLMGQVELAFRAAGRLFEMGMWYALAGAVAVVSLSVLASIVLILIPAGIIYLKAFWDGARGRL